MLATRFLRDNAMVLLAADPATLAPVANAIYLALVKTNFAPSEGLVLADITLADFTGSTAIGVTVGAQPEGFDPATDASIIDLSPPVGGFRWVTGDVVHLPQTIYGYVLLNHAKTIVWGSALLVNPLVLSLAAQVVDIGDVRLSLAPGSIS